MRKKNKYGKSIAVFIVLLGLSVFLYPFAQILKNELVLNKEIETYSEKISGMAEEERSKMAQEVEVYNNTLVEEANGVVDPFANTEYNTPSPISNMGDDGVFGYISIPKIDETLPLYLGASEGHLAWGAAQLDGTSIPVGGVGTRSVIAGHRGYYNRLMFQYLDRLEPGDEIFLYVMGGKLTYIVENSEDIYPSQNEKIMPIPGKDMITLLTCTPFPTNKMRLLVNAVRLEEQSYSGNITEDISDLSKDKTDSLTASRKKIIKGVAIVGSVVWILVFIFFIKLTVKAAGGKR